MDLAGLVNGMIPFLLGVWCTLVGFGRIKPTIKWGDPAEWTRRWPPLMRVIGPILILFGVLRWLGAFATNR